jgi:DNA polymerase phi
MYMPKLEDGLTSLISAACSQASSSFTAPQLKEVLKTGLTAVRQTKRFLSSAADVWDSGKWNEIHDQLVKSARFSKSTGLHALCKQVRDQIAGTGSRSSEKKQHAKEGEQGTSKGKRKATEVAGVLDQAETSKKVKRKKSKA